MKKTLTSFCALILAVSSVWVDAAETEKSRQSSAEFERMKTLAGTWQGKADMGEGPIEMTVHYRVLAGGSVLEERVFAGTPNEMVTMYFEKDGQLALTHYCVIGNRPGMLLKSSDDKTLKFAFDPNCGIDVLTESHMNALTIRFDDPDTITTTCKSIMGGKAMEGSPTVLRRVHDEKASRASAETKGL